MTRPTSETELAELIRTADAPWWIAGGGTRLPTPSGAPPLSTAGLSGVTLYDPGALTLVCQAGTPLREVIDTLAAENQQLPFEPCDLAALLGHAGASTIGGVVATNASGPRRVQAGACRDLMLGVRFVDGQGTIVKNGGRVMKNVTGYDLVRLMAGAHGTLGVLTEVAFKVLPRPDASLTVQLSDQDITQAVATMAAAMGSPLDVSGAAHDPALGRTYLRLEGFEASVQERGRALAQHLSAFGQADILSDPQASRDLWAGLRDAAPLRDKTGDLWRISVKPSDAPKVLTALPATSSLLDWAGGLIWAVVPQGTDVRHALTGIAGHATCLRGAQPRFHPEPPALAQIAAGLRAQFDPRGVLNPGLMADHTPAHLTKAP